MLHSFSEPELRKQSGMVYEIWEDGEITLQKSGELYGQRNLHMIVPGWPGVNIPMPDKVGTHSCMAIDGKNIAKAREIMAQMAGTIDAYKDCLPGKASTGKELFEEINKRNSIT